MKFLSVTLIVLGLLLPSFAQPAESVTTETKVEGYGSAVAENGSQVSMSYILRLGGGQIVDASPDGKPLSFSVGNPSLLAGFNQGVLGMKEGEVREVVIPASLGYGNRETGPIPPNSTLYFELKLLKLAKPPVEDAELSEVFGRDGSGSRESAQEITKPAVFEYLIRDFFTRPWRYKDAAGLVWQSNAVLTAVALMLLALVRVLSRESDEEPVE